MKTLKFIALIWVSAIGCLLLGGCATLDKLYDKEIVEVRGEQAVQDVLYRTNTVVIEPERIDENGTVIPAKVAQVIQPEVVVRYAPPTYVTNLVPRASVQTGIQMSGAVPVPWAGTAALALGWMYSAYAALRNKKVAKVLAQSVQVGREFLQSTPEGQRLDSAFKAKLQKHQQYAGVADLVKVLLNKYVPDHTQAKG